MNIKENLRTILDELLESILQIDEEQVETFTEEIINANHIFLTGAGRSGLVIKAFSNRLMHLGFSVSVLGEINTPHTQKDDLLIICSGSGETGSLKSTAEKAMEKGLQILLITTNEKSSIANISNAVVKLEGVSKTQNDSSRQSKQPMGTLFEQGCFILFDALVLLMMDKLSQNSTMMFARHADLE